MTTGPGRISNFFVTINEAVFPLHETAFSVVASFIVKLALLATSFPSQLGVVSSVVKAS